MPGPVPGDSGSDDIYHSPFSLDMTNDLPSDRCNEEKLTAWMTPLTGRLVMHRALMITMK